MKQHTGMRPHDLFILCAVILQKNDDWFMKTALIKHSHLLNAFVRPLCAVIT